MQHQPSRKPEELEGHLLGLIEAARDQAREDPFRNPVLAVTLAITRRFDRNEISAADLDSLFVRLRAASLESRAARLRAYVGLEAGPVDPQAAIPARLVAAVPDRPDAFEGFADFIRRTAFAVVFTAHPTFGMPRAVASLLAEAASLPDETARTGLIAQAAALSTRPDAPITLDVEFEQACAAANNGRLALDAFNGAALDAARARWPDRWTELTPRPFAIASWVGCDTDGRTDIGWWDTLRYRLISKRMQFDRVMRELPEIGACREVRALAEGALAAVNRQLAVAPRLGDKPSLEAV
ncbi:MAG: phosphoenolpyruvate carboxylase, partial [Hyphomicrobiales bacterium]